MAQPFTLKLGNLDLSNYVRLAPGEGFDPVDDAGYMNPAFNDAPLAEGQLLTNLDVGNRELAWPLHLSAANKDAAHALIQSINAEVRNNPNLRVEWKDTGASNSTFYDVSYARFDPEFNYRRSALNWESGTLKVWCTPPHGHTGTERLIASGLGASGIPAFLVPVGSIMGDAPALPRISMVPQPGASGLIATQMIAAWAVAPSPSYAPWSPAASLISSESVALVNKQGATWAYGSQAIYCTATGVSYAASRGMRVILGQLLIATSMAAAGVYSGRNRVFAFVAVGMPSYAAASVVATGVYPIPTIAWSAADTQGNLLGPTAVYKPDNVTTAGSLIGPLTHAPVMLDLGIISIPTYAQQPVITVTAGMATTQSGHGGPSYGFTPTLSIIGIALMPEDTLTYVNTPNPTPMYSRKTTVTWDAIGPDDSTVASSVGTLVAVNGSISTFGYADGYALDYLRRGPITRLYGTPTTNLIFLAHQYGGTTGSPQQSSNEQIGYSVTVRERFQFAR